MIYFVQAGEHGPIKIGYVEEEDRTAVLRRLNLLQVGNHERLYLRATTPGGLTVERDLHQRLAAGHVRGEWFRPDTPGLASLIRRAREQETVTAWQLRDDGQQLCEWCGTGIVIPPRRSLCSDDCAAAKREAQQRQRRAA